MPPAPRPIDLSRARALQRHPSRRLRLVTAPPIAPEPNDPPPPRPEPEVPAPRPGEDGSLVTEYGLLAILGATITGLAIKWAVGGAIWELFGAVLKKVRALVGA